MTPEEFERLKEEEKRHLRELRALKTQHRDAQRKKGLLDALRGLTNPEADATHEEMLDRLTRQIEVEGPLTDEQRARLLEIADRCPVHKTLHREIHVRTHLVSAGDPTLR